VDEDADWAWQAAKPVPPPAAGPAPPPPTPEQLLGARLEPLLAKGFPDTPEETDLADAVCALRRRGWPRYAGPLDILVLERVLAARPALDARQLNRLAGCGAPKRPPQPQPPPPPPPTPAAAKPAPRPSARRPRKPARTARPPP
jgi:hypothetical protein